MADILSLHGYNRSISSVNKLFSVYGNDIVDVDTNTGYSQNLTPGYYGEFETYIDYCYYANGIDKTRSFNGTSWSQNGMRNRAPTFKYLQSYGVRLFGGYVGVNGQTFPSRVWYTDLPQNYDVRWGIEWGTNLSQTKNSPNVVSNGAYFSQYGIKSGDKLFILTGANAGEYYIYSINSNNSITLTENLKYTATNSSYIAGGNYFDVKTEDNDYLRGLGENSNRLLCFKLFSLHRYNGSSLLQVPKAVGTSSARSIINNGNTFYFNGSEGSKTGIYMYDGVESIKISNAIQPYINGISSTMYPSITAWSEGDWIRMYVGDITNTQRNISVLKAVISYNTNANAWSVDPINKVISTTTTFMESSESKIFLGDSSGEVFQTPSGYTFDGDPIPWAIETGPHYPMNSEELLKYTRIQVIARDAKGVRVRYKLYNNPRDIDQDWLPLGEIKGDKTEFIVPPTHSRASGINIRFEESGIRENTQFIEKVTVFYIVDNSTFI